MFFLMESDMRIELASSVLIENESFEGVQFWATCCNDNILREGDRCL